MKLDITNIILSLLGVMLVLCFILILTDKQQENFDPVMDAIQTQIKTENPEQLKQTIQSLQQRLICKKIKYSSRKSMSTSTKC